jgi:WD40 repeat protein
MPAFNLDKLKVARTAKLGGGDLVCLACRPDSEQLWVGSSDFKVHVLDLAQDKPQPVTLEKHQSYVTGAVFAGKYFITASWDRQLIWWETEKRTAVRTLPAHERWIRKLALSPDGKVLATIGDDMVARLWEAESGKPIRTLKGHALRLPRYEYHNKLYACAFSPDGKLLAANDETAQVIIWETDTGKEATRFQAAAFYHGDDWVRNNHPYGGLRCLAFAPDGKTLALAGMHNTDVAIINGSAMVQVYDWQAGKQLQEFKSKDSNSQYETLCFHPRGDWLLAGVGGGSKTGLHFFDQAGKRLVKDLPSAHVFGLEFVEKTGTIYTVGRAGQVNKWASVA